jgi:methyl-accepting chemotaxis protein
MAREYVKDIGAVRDVSAELNDLFGNFGDQLENISVAEMKILDNAKKVVKEFADSKKYNKENRDYAEYISNKLKEDIKSVREKNGLVQEVNEHVEQQAGMYDDITDKLKEEKDILKNGIVGAFKELDNLIGGIGQNIINNLTSPMGILLTAVGFILNIFLKWNAALQEIHDSFGAFVSVGDELYNITKQQRLELIQTGANMQELLGSADNLSKAMGLTLEESVKLSGEAYKTHRELGIEVSTVESLFELQQEILGICIGRYSSKF